MKLNFTKNDYRLLLDMITTADWVMNAHKPQPDDKTQPYDDLQQKIFASAHEYGFDNLIHHDKETGEYFPSSEFEESSNTQIFIDEYDEDTFWETLATRMAQRDLVDKIGEKSFDAMEPEERMAEVDKITDKYLDEFTENGIMSLQVTPPVVG